MTRYEIEQELDSLYQDLDIAHNADDQTVCRTFNVDTKQEAIRMLTSEIDNYEAVLEQFDLPDDDGMDYDALCRVQGLARYA